MKSSSRIETYGFLGKIERYKRLGTSHIATGTTDFRFLFRFHFRFRFRSDEEKPVFLVYLRYIRHSMSLNQNDNVKKKILSVYYLEKAAVIVKSQQP